MSTTPPARTDRELDVVLVGASGFVGQLTAAHLAAEAGSARIALAGRSTARLTAVRDELGAAAAVSARATDSEPAASAARATATTGRHARRDGRSDGAPQDIGAVGDAARCELMPERYRFRRGPA
jgi:threonine dehydrogenase-like Zn-dependent dehydrogenase